jgi:hypothetical protein
VSEKKRFWILLAILALSIGLAIFLNSTYSAILG